MLDMRKFRTHIEILKHTHPELVVQLAPEPAGHPADITGASDGFVLKWNGKTLHSVKSPEGEARHLLDNFKFESGRVYLVFGIGLGHLADGARSQLPPQSRLILIEPDIGILREALACVDFRPLLYDQRVSWVSGKKWREHLTIVLRRITGSGCRASGAILSLPAYRTYFKKALDETRSLLVQFMNEREIDTGTRQELWHVWNHNLTANLNEILSSAPLRNFTTTFDRIPSVLVGAGPSLDDNLKDLHRLKESALLVAVDTALAPMLSAGCEPDLVLAMDAQEENARDFSNLPPHSTTILFDAFCYPSIPKLYPREFRIASLTGHIFSDFDDLVVVKNGLLPLLEYILDYGFGFLQNGGSVITAGFDLARLAGCPAIGLVGVDLSYPGFQTHSRLTQRSRLKHDIRSRFDTNETDFLEYVFPKSKMCIESIRGGEVWSDRVMVMYKNWMEDAALKTGLPCFSLGDSGGARLRGYSPMSIDDFTATFHASRTEIDSRMARCRARRPSFKSEISRTRLAEIRNAIAVLDRDPAAASIGPFDLDRFVDMASFEVAERLRAVLSVEPESEHQTRRQQAARTCRQWVLPFLDGLETALADL